MKAFRELLVQYEDMIGSSASEVGTAAVAEMSALVEMARTIIDANDYGTVPHDKAAAAWEQLRALAKESP
jgi:hypothetical protein